MFPSTLRQVTRWPQNPGVHRGSTGTRTQNQCVKRLTPFYWPRCARAVRIGASEIRISPWKGVYISRIKKIAPETDRAHRNKVAITVAFGGRIGRSWRKLWRAKKPALPATVSRWRCFLFQASASAIFRDQQLDLTPGPGRRVTHRSVGARPEFY